MREAMRWVGRMGERWSDGLARLLDFSSRMWMRTEPRCCVWKERPTRTAVTHVWVAHMPRQSGANGTHSKERARYPNTVLRR